MSSAAWRSFSSVAVRDIRLQRRPQREGAAALVPGLDGQKRAADIGMHDQRIGLLFRRLDARERAALDALARIVGGVLVGDFGDGETLQAHAEAGFVHHHEHGVEALVLRADEIAGRAVIVHDAGRVAVNAHLVLDGAAGDGIALARRAVVLQHEFRHDEERNALGASGAPSMRASTRWMMFSDIVCSPAEMKIFWPEIL